MVIINRSLSIELRHITSAGLDLTPPTVERNRFLFPFQCIWIIVTTMKVMQY